LYVRDRAYSKDIYINGTLHDIPVLRLTCGSDAVVCADPIIERYSEFVRRFNRGVWPIITGSAISSKAFAEVSTLLSSTETSLLGMFFSPLQQGVVRDSIIGPVRKYIDSLQARIVAIRKIESNANKSVGVQNSDALEFRLPANSLSKASLSNEAYMMIRAIAYSSSYQLPMWLGSESHTSDTRMTVDMARRVLTLVGEFCACEVGYGIFFRSSVTLGRDFTSCSDSLPRLLMQLAETDSTFYCSRLKTDLQSLCSALSKRTIESIAGAGRDSVLANRALNMDSIYVLHFWGTWCKPCIEGLDLVQSTADTLESLGCHTIHIACENQDRFSAWQELVEKYPGEHLFTHKSQGAIKMLSDQLAISSFPTFLIVGHGGEILARDIEVEKLTDFIRYIAK